MKSNRLEYVIDFLNDVEFARSLSENTVKAYRQDLNLFTKFWRREQSISKFIAFLQRKKLSARSRARVMSSVREYFRFVQSRGGAVPELRELVMPKFKTPLPKTLTLEEFKKLLIACEVEDADLTCRNKVVLMLLYGLGCRVSELVNLEVEDFRRKEQCVRLTGKGGRERVVPISRQLADFVAGYLEKTRPYLVEDTDSLIVNNRGNRPSRVDVWRWVSIWGKKAGIEEVHPHMFRHGCATALLESGADLRSIQELLGHSSISTTQIYTNVSAKALTETIDQFHPLSKKGESNE